MVSESRLAHEERHHLMTRKSEVIAVLESRAIAGDLQDAVIGTWIQDRFDRETICDVLQQHDEIIARCVSLQDFPAHASTSGEMRQIVRDGPYGNSATRQEPGRLESGDGVQSNDDGRRTR
jgi:hypothetical protein